MKSQRDQEMKEMQAPSSRLAPGNPLVKSTKQKQLDYLKAVKFNGFTSTNSQSRGQTGLLVGADGQPITDALKEQDIIRDLLYVFQGIDSLCEVILVIVNLELYLLAKVVHFIHLVFSHAIKCSDEIDTFAFGLKFFFSKSNTTECNDFHLVFVQNLHSLMEGASLLFNSLIKDTPNLCVIFESSQLLIVVS